MSDTKILSAEESPWSPERIAEALEYLDSGMDKADLFDRLYADLPSAVREIQRQAQRIKELEEELQHRIQVIFADVLEQERDAAILRAEAAEAQVKVMLDQEMFPGAINRMDELGREVEALRAEVKAATATIARQGEELASLREAVWPGKPAWKPTTQEPQQDFSEAFAECLWSNNRLLTKIKVLIHEDEEVGLRASQELAENPIGTSPDSSTGTADDAIPAATVEAIRVHPERPCCCDRSGINIDGTCLSCGGRIMSQPDAAEIHAIHALVKAEHARTEPRPIQAGDTVRHRTEGWTGTVEISDGYTVRVNCKRGFYGVSQLERVEPEKGESAER